MKTPTTIQTELERRLQRTWHTDLTGVSTSWPHAFPLGNLSKTELQDDFAAIQLKVREWRDWTRTHDVGLTTTARRVHGTLQDIPTHVTITNIDTAARLAGRGWVQRLDRSRRRLEVITGTFLDVENPGRLLRSIDDYSETDFELLLTTAGWFANHDARGYTPRQVPIEGVHAKWLDTHRPHILALTGRDDLELLPAHPARIHFTYLDPTHRANGGRWHDSATVGDPFVPEYIPDVVLISENKDTAIHFPPTSRGISVEGAGYGGSTAAAFPWLTHAPHLYYWGDIDAHGYEILNGFREAGAPVTSMLMDLDTYDTYQCYGTNHDKNNTPLTPSLRKPLPLLTDAERAAYYRITDPEWTGHRRIEQERIPLRIAHDTLIARFMVLRP